MMIRVVMKGLRSWRNKAPSSFSMPILTATMSSVRLLSTEINTSSSANPVALQMINYASSLARQHRTEDSYARGLMVLEQCQSSHPDHNSKAFVQLARSTLFFERGSHEEAIETLQEIQDLRLSAIAVKVAASEALAGIHLELYQEDSALMVTNTALKLVDGVGSNNEVDAFEVRLRALKGLVELICGNSDSEQSFLDSVPEDSWLIGNAAVSYGEFFHSIRDFSTAKRLYQKVIYGMSEMKDFDDPVNVGACNMIPAQVAIAATCALGQLEAHMGNFIHAEELLTAALNKTEEYLGPRHPKVGVILTCIALMYRNKAIAERSSSLLIQEGLFRRAIELLKAPPLEADGAAEIMSGKDIIALARGGYAETLCVQQSRKAEGEQLKHWAEATWRNRQMSLGEALVLESSRKVPVIDTRICRVL